MRIFANINIYLGSHRFDRYYLRLCQLFAFYSQLNRLNSVRSDKCLCLYSRRCFKHFRWEFLLVDLFGFANISPDAPSNFSYDYEPFGWFSVWFLAMRILRFVIPFGCLWFSSFYRFSFAFCMQFNAEESIGWPLIWTHKVNGFVDLFLFGFYALF